MEMDKSDEENLSLKDSVERVRGEKYPWHLLRRTILLLNIFLGNVM